MKCVIIEVDPRAYSILFVIARNCTKLDNTKILHKSYNENWMKNLCVSEIQGNGIWKINISKLNIL